MAGRSHRRGFAEVRRVDREPGKPCDLAPKRSNADEPVVAQLLQLDAPRDLKIEFEMSMSRAAGGFVHPERAERPHGLVKPWLSTDHVVNKATGK